MATATFTLGTLDSGATTFSLLYDTNTLAVSALAVTTTRTNVTLTATSGTSTVTKSFSVASGQQSVAVANKWLTLVNDTLNGGVGIGTAFSYTLVL